MGKYWWTLLQLSFLRVFCLQNELLCYVLSFNLFSYPVISDSLRPYGLQHARLPCPSPSPGACSNSSIESVMPYNHLIFCCPLPLLSSVFPSIRVFSNESALHTRWPKYCSFSFSIIKLKIKNLIANAGDVRHVGLIPGQGRCLGIGHGNPLQYSCLENSHGQKSPVGYSP